MGKGQRVFTTTLWALLVLIMLAVIGSGLWGRLRARAAPVKLDVLFNVPAFSLTDQNNQPMTDKDLRGHVWICDFIYTHCAGPCPIMSHEIATLQKTIADPSVKFVSFTVDPQTDTPAQLKAYAHSFAADESRWSLLTGTQEQLSAVVAGMKLTLVPAAANQPILHDVRFVLIDPQGRIRKYCDSQDADAMKQLPLDAAALVGQDAAQ